MILSALVLLLVVLVTGCRDAQPDGPSTRSAVLQQGEQLYNDNCRSCHGGATGGEMMDIPPPHNANGHTWHHSDCQLKETILTGSGAMGRMMREMMGASPDTPRMPAFEGQLTEEEVAAILAYIKTWWTPEQREVQARITEEQCQEGG